MLHLLYSLEVGVHGKFGKIWKTWRKVNNTFFFCKKNVNKELDRSFLPEDSWTGSAGGASLISGLSLKKEKDHINTYS